MDLAVAVETGTTSKICVGMPNEPALVAGCARASRIRALVRPVMTLLAHERGTGYQQRRNVRTVRRMAVPAVLGDGLMFEQEGAALLRVAGVAGLVHRVLLDQLRSRRAVWIVTVRTYDLADLDRVGRKLEAFGALLLVAGKADFGLRFPVENLLRRCM